MFKLRYIDTGTLEGSTNMAIDETLSDVLAKQRNHVYLRFYRWSPATISFGYNQKAEKILDLEAVNKLDYSVVKRMSGGKMVYHDQELTFSLGMPIEFIELKIGKKQNFLDMFYFAMESIVIALKSVGIPARFSTSTEVKKRSSNKLHCYAATAGHSIYAKNHKLIGAAGVFKQNCLIIHGSIPIIACFPSLSIFSDEYNISQDVNIAALSDYCNSETIACLPQTIAREYSKFLKIDIANSCLTPEESLISKELAEKKYSILDW